MIRALGYGLDALRLLSMYGLVGGVRILFALVRPRGPVTFRSRGNTYVMPSGVSTRHHLLHSVEKLHRLAEYIRPEDEVIVDVGAHAGLFSAFAAERAPNAQCLLIEPESSMRPVIERNLVGRAWRLVSAAVSDRSGEATFFRAQSSQESSFFPDTIWSSSEPTTVPTVTLDEVCADLTTIDVLKIDVQSAEHLVLAGASETLPKVRTLLIEVSLMDPEPHVVLQRLRADFGPWTVVNEVRAGADLAFERGHS